MYRVGFLLSDKNEFFDLLIKKELSAVEINFLMKLIFTTFLEALKSAYLKKVDSAKWFLAVKLVYISENIPVHWGTTQFN